MDNIDVRKYIISNFKDSSIEEIKSLIEESIALKEDDPLSGLGVIFELLRHNISSNEQTTILNNIKKGM